jgi:phosphoserine aminotransferase
LIIIKKSLLGKADKDTPVMCDWNLFENSPDGYYNTPPCYTTYVMALNISYMNQKGGIENYDRLSDVKSRMLYSLIDNSQGYYVNKC